MPTIYIWKRLRIVYILSLSFSFAFKFYLHEILTREYSHRPSCTSKHDTMILTCANVSIQRVLLVKCTRNKKLEKEYDDGNDTAYLVHFVLGNKLE